MYNFESKKTVGLWTKSPKNQLCSVLKNIVEISIREIIRWFNYQPECNIIPIELKQTLFDANLIIIYLERSIKEETTCSDIARSVSEIINSRRDSEYFCSNPTTRSFCNEITTAISPYLDEAVNCNETEAPVV